MSNEPLAGVLEEYFDYCRVVCAVETLKQYDMVLRKVVSDLGGQSRLPEEITPRELQRYQAHRWGHLKRSTLANYTAILKSFFSWAVSRGYIEQSPARLLKRPPRSKDSAEIRAIPPEHLRQMLEYTRHTSKRNYAILMFLIATGCRVGGLLSLGMDDLDLNNYRATIRLKGGKMDKVFWGDKTKKALEGYLAWRPNCGHDRVWIWDKKPYKPLKDGGVYAMIVDTCQRINLPREYFTHGTRHSVGISWTQAGVALGIVSSKLNHSDIGVTQRFYAQQDQEFIAKVSRLYETLPLEDDPMTAMGSRIIRAG